MANKKNEQPKRLRARDEGKVIPYTVELTPQHASALEACCEGERRTKKAVVLLALEKYLASAGFWPPATEAAEPKPPAAKKPGGKSG